ncbi:MAG: LPS-assembly protein LptD [Planctomycetota bacterium]|jgi:lipopolysaccharide assembly outer membrane protein LptD (OstA)
MRNRTLLILFFLILLSGPVFSAIDSSAKQVPDATAFVGQDLHMEGRSVINHQLSTGEHILIFRDGFLMSIGANQFSSESAVVWLIPRSAVPVESTVPEKLKVGDRSRIGYKAMVYLQGGVSAEKAKSARMTSLTGTVIEQGRVMAVQAGVSGEVFVTAENRRMADPRGLALYEEAFSGLRKVGFWPTTAEAQPQEIEFIEEPVVAGIKPEDEEPKFRYPLHYSGVGEVVPKIEWDETTRIGTIIGRIYLWQKKDEKGGLLEFMADNVVMFRSPLPPDDKEKRTGDEDILGGGDVKAIYLSGDVLMTEGPRTIRAEEIYYDFEAKKALAVKAIMRKFDETDGIPIYIKAAKLRQLAENKFGAENITLTTSEFYVPQLSFNASKVIITDTTSLDTKQGEVPKSSFDAQMHDVRLKLYDKTIFYWPLMRSNLQRPDTPLKTARVGRDNTWGTQVETQWYLARLLGLEEPEGTDSTLSLDYYSKRGFGSGIEVDYAKENYFGRIFGYIINDRGQDRLGRHVSRKHLEPERDLRGRFSWQHRQFLPFDWQLTTEISYLSDEHFMESFHRGEFNVGKEQETLIHAKRIEDNWGLSLLSKVRINDFVDELEELPSAEFHWTGQSFLDDNLTFYSDTQVGRFRERYMESAPAGPQQFFSFVTTRNELDMPLMFGTSKVVPFVAGTVAYEDGLGFYSELDGGTGPRDDDVWFGEAGVRVSSQPYWKVFPSVESKIWDVNQLRHIIRPYLTAVTYTETDSVIEQRDTLSVGISQRLQTKRGTGDNQRTVDWMWLDTHVTWVNDSDDAAGKAGPDRFIWNKPFIPLLNRFNTTVNPRNRYDRRNGDIFGPRRNYFGADYIWRMSDTTAVLSDMNFDIQSGVVQQYNVGLSHMRWPDLSYYIGSRYLRRLDNGYGEHGSNAFTFAATYRLDPRYTLVYSGQLDFDYGKTVRSDFTLVRQYHRIFCGITYSADSSLDRQAIVFSIWPQGVPDLAIGSGRYMGTSGLTEY